jgi:hypothetical protein
MPRDGEEIGLVEMPVRRKRAMTNPTPQALPLASAPIEPVETPVRKRRAKSAATPRPIPPGVSPTNETVKELVSLQSSRQFCITQKNRSERAIEQLIASTMGFRLDTDEKDRKSIFARAKAFRLAVEKGGEGHADPDTQSISALSAIVPLVAISADNRAPWVKLRKDVEKQMADLATYLPVYDFAKSVRGLGDLGLACLVAEAGIPIGDYRTVSGLWSRMGLGVKDGQRQGGWCNKEQLVNDNGDPTLRYAPKRRAEAWAFCSDSMFRGQWAGDKDEDGNDPKKSGKPVLAPAHAVGPYGEVYGRRRMHTASRVIATESLPTTDRDKWTNGRCHNDARRIMTKALLRDLWRVWRGMPPRGVE